MIRTSHWEIAAKISDLELTYKEDVKIVDIGVGGLCFQSSRRFRTGDVAYLDLRINAPFLPDENIIATEIRTEVKWGKLNIEPHSFGVQFINLAESTRTRLLSLIQRTETKFGDLTSPLFR
jgi:hypothetical protein